MAPMNQNEKTSLVWEQQQELIKSSFMGDIYIFTIIRQATILEGFKTGQYYYGKTMNAGPPVIYNDGQV
jgi:hypothetical protein